MRETVQRTVRVKLPVSLPLHTSGDTNRITKLMAPDCKVLASIVQHADRPTSTSAVSRLGLPSKGTNSQKMSEIPTQAVVQKVGDFTLSLYTV